MTKQADKTTLSLIIPIYNEEDTIEAFLERSHESLRKANDLYVEYIFVNDGSTDRSLSTLLSAQRKYPSIKILEFSRNFGKEAALTAGILEATGQIIVPIDADLQDPPELIIDMVSKWREGFDVVLARRVSRKSDGWTKRVTANWFYKLHNKIAEPRLPENVGDFRLMDRCVVEALRQLPESRRFMKGLLAWLGFRTTTIDYQRPARIAGSTKFNGWRLWNFALEGITSFSTSPLRIWTYIGSFVALLSFIFAIFIATRVIILGIDVPGYASLIVAVTFLGGLQLIGIGILGEYLGRTYLESKRRPSYIIRKTYTSGDSNGY